MKLFYVGMLLKRSAEEKNVEARQESHRQTLITHCSLLTAHCPLLTANRSLLIALYDFVAKYPHTRRMVSR